ncbi:hypothetical protein [Nostoc sp.]
MDVFAQLKEFRQAAYECLCRAKDATWELMDAILLFCSFIPAHNY